MFFSLGSLIGCLFGAVGHHCILQYKINRVDGGVPKDIRQHLLTLFSEHPYLMSLIKSNLNDPEYKSIREFFVVDSLAIMNSSRPRLRYDFSDEMEELLKKLSHLGFIKRLDHDSLLYCLDDKFVAHLVAFSMPST